MTKWLSEARFELLTKLINSNGYQRGVQLTIPARRLGSMMQIDRLTDWQRPDQSTWNLEDWTLHITDAGRSAVDAELRRRKFVGKRKEPRG